MKLTDYLTEKNIRIGINGESKDEIIGELLNIVSSVSPEININEALTGLKKRERLGSTGIGGGVAIPHSGIKSCSRILPVIAIAPEGVNYSSLDGDPVRIFFLILYPEDQINMQLKFLARVSRLLRNCSLRDSLIKCTTPEDAINILIKYELEHFT